MLRQLYEASVPLLFLGCLQLQAFAAFCALARDGAKAASQLESKGAFAALQQAMRQTDGPCKKGKSDLAVSIV